MTQKGLIRRKTIQPTNQQQTPNQPIISIPWQDTLKLKPEMQLNYLHIVKNLTTLSLHELN